MRIVLRILLFIVILAGAAFALLLLFPFLKEGVSLGDLPILLSAAAGLVALGMVWWLLGGKGVAKVAGLALLALPLAGHLFIVGQLLAAQLRGPRLAQAVTIQSYRESPIVWPGFDGPVGLMIALELAHPPGAPGVIYPPEIRMGPELEIPGGDLVSTRTSGAGYFKDSYLDQEAGALTLLKAVLFQKLHDPPHGARGFDAGGTTRLTYHLYPGTLDYLPGQDRLCLASESAGIAACKAGQRPEQGCRAPNRRAIEQPVYHDGAELSALWLAAGGYDMVADLSAQLTTALRRHSSLHNDPAGWTALQRRLEPAGLATAGYGLCPPAQDSHSAFRVCFCR